MSDYTDLIDKLEEIATIYMNESDDGSVITFPPINLTFLPRDRGSHIFELTIGYGDNPHFFDGYDLEEVLNKVINDDK